MDKHSDVNRRMSFFFFLLAYENAKITTGYLKTPDYMHIELKPAIHLHFFYKIIWLILYSETVRFIRNTQTHFVGKMRSFFRSTLVVHVVTIVI